MKRQDVNVQVVNNISQQERFSLFGLLMLVGMAIWLWKFFLLAAALTTIVVICVSVRRKAKHLREEILRRADQQHAWEMKGDPRGTYGEGFPGAYAWVPKPSRGPVPKLPEERRIASGENVTEPCPRCMALHDVAVSHE